MDVRIDGQVAIVTGGDSGLGRSIATQLAEAGASVVVNYHQNEGKAAETVHEIEAHGGKAISFGGDVASEEDVDRLVAAAVSAFGGRGYHGVELRQAKGRCDRGHVAWTTGAQSSIPN